MMFTHSLFRFTVSFLLYGILSGISLGDVRTWTDSTGRHRVEAEFVSVDKDTVTLRSAAGKQITLSISRLSADDQSFIRKQTAKGDNVKTAAKPMGKPATAKPVVKRFYADLLDQNFDDIKTLLTPAAQSNWEAAKTLIEELDVPDGRRAILVRTAKVQDDMVIVNVSIKVRGKYKKHHLQLRWSDDKWLVAALVPDGEDEDPISFETDKESDRAYGRSRDSHDDEEDEDLDEEEQDDEDEEDLDDEEE